jgi:HK97 family phage prohead protease
MMYARRAHGGPLELRRGSSSGTKLVGRAVPYAAWSLDLGGFRERIMFGAASTTIAQDDIRAQHNHDSNFILGRMSNGTLTLREEEDGVHYEVQMPETQFARDLAVQIERGDITGNSFAMYVGAEDEEWEEGPRGLLRTIRGLRLVEVGPQPYPAYANDTDVQVRSLSGPEEAQAVLQRGELVIAKRHATVVVPAFVGRHPSVLALEMEMEAE